MLCATHQREMLVLAGKSVCAECLGDGSAPAVRRLEEFRARSTRSAADARLRDAGIPAEVAGKGFAGFHAESDHARSIAQNLHNYAASFATRRAARKGFIFIGQPGTAKTHLACAIAEVVIEAGHTAVYASLPRLTSALRASYGRRGATEAKLQLLQDVDLLILDEIDLHGTSDNDYNTLYDLVNARYEREGFPTIGISNRPLDRLERDLDERIVTRILAGTKPISFDWPGRRTTQMVRKLATEARNV